MRQTTCRLPSATLLLSQVARLCQPALSPALGRNLGVCWVSAGATEQFMARSGHFLTPRSEELLSTSARGLVDPELGPEHVAHLAQRGPQAQGLLHGHQEALG